MSNLATEPMTVDEWKRRYAARIMEVAKWPECVAIENAEVAADELDDMLDTFRNCPEDAADEEISCWSDDCDE